MIYADMHCDALTASLSSGQSIVNGGLQVTLEKLKKSCCAAQCFAIFTRDGRGAKSTVKKCVALFKTMLEENKTDAMQILCAADFLNCVKTRKTGCILTVENLGFIGGDLSEIDVLHTAGVRMASLVWNDENALAFPNLQPPQNLSINEEESGSLPEWFLKRNLKPLKSLGREAANELDRLKIIIDVSHLSDGGTNELLKGRKIPLVASHSNAAGVCNVSRNLTDKQIKAVSECGGVVGINFCADFLGGENAMEAVARHLKHVINIGGEDVAAFGSDFDGIPQTPQLEDCTRMPALIEVLEEQSIPLRVLEKVAYKNFLRVFKDVCG